MWDWDSEKQKRNFAKHGVEFSAATEFNWESALTASDDRRDYGERRFVSIGFIGERLHVLIWAERGERLRIISLRKANAREVKHYAKNI
jgi:uncharacterized DUF497 family protein